MNTNRTLDKFVIVVFITVISDLLNKDYVTHTHTPADTPVDTPARTNIHIHAHTYTYRHIYMHTYTHACGHTQLQYIITYSWTLINTKFKLFI